VPGSGSHQKAGPGVGVRLNNTWQPPKPSAIRYTQPTSPDKEATKLEKIKTLLAGPNTNIGSHAIWKISPSLQTFFKSFILNLQM